MHLQIYGVYSLPVTTMQRGFRTLVHSLVHSPLALVSALLGVQDLQSRFSIFTRDQTRLTDAIHVIRKKSGESLEHKSKHIPSAARLSRRRQGKLLAGL